MDHVSDDYGHAGIQVEWVRGKGAAVDVPQDKLSFHSYPDRKGWKVETNYKLQLLPGNGTTTPEEFDVFLQSWLFFGLILTVVQKDQKPILEYQGLHHQQKFLDTKKLRGALKEWAAWELGHKDGIEFRMIQVGYILETAQKVVRKNCGYDLQKDSVEYSTNIDHSAPEAGVSRHITDSMALCLMTVGEMLSAVKLTIMDETKIGIPGWHTDDDGGWGPPRYVFKQMETRGWCARAVHLLKGQLQSNATVILAAYLAYKDSTRMIKNHENCTAQECISQPLNDQGLYECCHMEDCRRDQCTRTGPDINKVLEILDSKPNDAESSFRAGSDIPLLIFEGEDGGPIKLKVIRQSLHEKFATISHVWSDGWGNEGENQLQDCQLRFIRRHLKKLSENPDKDVPFWMDTLVCPVGKESERVDRLKKKAISQIFRVFQESEFTVIIDNGLWRMHPGEPDKPVQAAMKILASGWMRRLWTLQEAFISKKLFVIFQETGPRHDNWQNLDSLVEEIAPSKDVLTAPLMKVVRDQLLNNTMGQERLGRKFFRQKDGLNDPGRGIRKEKAATLVVNAWKAARWRVSINLDQTL